MDKSQELVEILEERITMDHEPTAKKGKPLTNGFIPKLKDKKVTIRLVSGGQLFPAFWKVTIPMRSICRPQKGSSWYSNMPSPQSSLWMS
jgi:hypothetical protein